MSTGISSTTVFQKNGIKAEFRGNANELPDMEEILQVINDEIKRADELGKKISIYVAEILLYATEFDGDVKLVNTEDAFEGIKKAIMDSAIRGIGIDLVIISGSSP